VFVMVLLWVWVADLWSAWTDEVVVFYLLILVRVLLMLESLLVMIL
jgi:hypothetical protein